MSLCGGLIALAILMARKLEIPLRHLFPSPVQARAGSSAAPARPSVPYGVAIAMAGVLVLVLQSSVPR
jgi:Flp pilus assembly protein protease CpaA